MENITNLSEREAFNKEVVIRVLLFKIKKYFLNNVNKSILFIFILFSILLLQYILNQIIYNI